MAIRPTPFGGDPGKTRLDDGGEKPPVVDELTESPAEDARMREGSTSALIAGGDLSLQERGHSEATAGIINRLPGGTKNMLGLSGGGRTDHLI
jgi:hypothetical protein